MPLGSGRVRCRWCEVGLVSVSVRPKRLSATGTTRDTGHHSRLVPRSCCWPPRHAALAPTALAAASRSVGSGPCPGLRGCTAGRCAGRRCLLAQAAGGRRRPSTSPRCPLSRAGVGAAEPVTQVRHLRQPGHRPGVLGLRARRHYRLAPRSDDAVSWRSRLRQGAAKVAAELDVGRGARVAALLGQVTHVGLFGQTGAGHVGGADFGRVSPGLAAAGLQEIRPARAPAEAGRAMR